MKGAGLEVERREKGPETESIRTGKEKKKRRARERERARGRERKRERMKRMKRDWTRKESRGQRPARVRIGLRKEKSNGTESRLRTGIS
jgi:hypothetical protein